MFLCLLIHNSVVRSGGHVKITIQFKLEKAISNYLPTFSYCWLNELYQSMVLNYFEILWEGCCNYFLRQREGPKKILVKTGEGLAFLKK